MSEKTVPPTEVDVPDTITVPKLSSKQKKIAGSALAVLAGLGILTYFARKSAQDEWDENNTTFETFDEN